MMARGGQRYMRRGRRVVPVDKYTGASFAAKREYQQRKAGRVQQPLYACRLCPVKVTGADREGHLRRAHSANGDVLVCFRLVKAT